MSPNTLYQADALTALEWAGCYSDSWKDLITPESFSHPAKCSCGLLKRILAHAKEEGWLQPGSILCDPFGGVGTTGILGAYEGYRCVLCELEEKFCRLAEDSFKLHAAKWQILGCPQPVILRGNSRNLSEILDKYNSSLYNGNYETNNTKTIKRKDLHIIPRGPFPGRNSGDGRNLSGVDSTATKRIRVSMQEFVGGSQTGIQNGATQEGAPSGETTRELQARQKQCGVSKDNSQRGMPELRGNRESGDSPQGQQPLRQRPKELGSPLRILPPEYNEAEMVGSEKSWATNTKEQCSSRMEAQIDLICSSPPYAETLKGDGSQTETAAESRAKRITEGGSLGQSQRTHGYGSAGNLGNLKPGDVAVIVSSPPYEGTPVIASGVQKKEKSWQSGKDLSGGKSKHYGNANGQLGENQGETFWSAARDIVAQCFQILKPSGYAIWVVKSFVRKGRTVDFPDDWRRLCESVGFKTLHEHHALLVKEERHNTLFGGQHVKRKERKSFFRRLAESKGSPRIDFECVLCQQKPTSP